MFSLMIICWFSCGTATSSEQAKPLVVHTDTIPTPINIPDTLSLNAVGDIMFGSSFPGTGYLAPNDGQDLMKFFTASLHDADLTFGNSEGVFLDHGGIAKDSGDQVYCFREPTRYAKYFVDNGFDLLSVANNHVADFGEAGLQSTIKTLSALPLHFVGLQNFPTAIVKVRNLRIGFAAFAPHHGCIQLNDIAAAKAAVIELKKQCDIVLVSFHAGAEGVKALHVPKHKELFYKQDRGDVYSFAHQMIDAGADILIGHGPHVARAMELYKNKLIAYSLGNFCTYGMFNLKAECGIAPLLKIYVTGKGDFIKANITSIKQVGEGGPQPDPDGGAYKLISTLTATDFPNSQLSFPGNGAVIRH